MKPTYTAEDLRTEIMTLEARRLRQEEELKATAAAAMTSLKPANILRHTVQSAMQSPGFGTTVLKGAVGLAAGFLSRKLIVRGSTNLIKRALGTAVEVGVLKAVANNAEKLKSGGRKLLQKVIH